MENYQIKLYAPELIERKEYSYVVRVHLEDGSQVKVSFPKSSSYCPEILPFELRVDEKILEEKEEALEQYIMCEDR